MHKFLFILFFTLQSVASSRYQVLFEDSQIFVPCSKYPDKFVTNLLDLSNSNHTLLANGKLYFAANLTLLFSESLTYPMKFSLQIFKKLRGTWTNTIFNIQRSNLCRALFDPTEIWYKTATNLKYDGVLCPFRKGFVLTVDTITEVIVNIPGNNHEGDYRADIFLTYGLGYKDFSCAVVYAQIMAIET